MDPIVIPSKFSKKKISEFIKEFSIDTNYLLKQKRILKALMTFFIRELRKEGSDL